MIATVKEVRFNVEMGKYRVTKLYVINDKGEDKEYTIFTNAKFHHVIAGLAVGDNVELKMEKNGKYWNISDVTKLDERIAHTLRGVGYKKEGSQQSGDKDLAIARAVSLKAAVELYSAMIGAGLTKKTLKPEAAQEEVFALCKKFEGYCTLAEDLDALSADTSALAGQAGEYEETEFPE